MEKALAPRHFPTIAFCFAALIVACGLCFVLAWRRASPPPATPSLKLQIIYHENHFLEGGNRTAVDGVSEYIFRNDTSAPLTVQMPPTEIIELTANSRRQLPKDQWPDFVLKPGSFTLPPGGRRVFTSKFAADVVKSRYDKNQIGINLRMVFDSPKTWTEEQGKAFQGTLASESIWDDSNTIEVK